MCLASLLKLLYTKQLKNARPFFKKFHFFASITVRKEHRTVAEAFFYKDVVMKAMEELRTPIDALEMMVDKEIWPVPSYGELAFEI